MVIYKDKSIKAASYSRLSREDGDKMESDSIRNQKDLIADYAAQKGIRITAEYVDDGYSGTSFDRPDFQRMMEDIKQKKINCIIVKDLSRLGRNYIETGRYLEKIFPFLGTRFIAVNDHYDSGDESSDADQIVVPFKNLINDAYCRDISIKIRSQLDVKRKNGKFIGSFAAYGYLKDPADKNHLIIDETAAEIVRTIFGLKLNGSSAQRISEWLDKMQIAPPFEYKRLCGFNFNSGFRSGRKPKWSVVTINRILKNELYIGTMVQGKNRKINYKVKQSRPIDEAEWIRVKETHEAIIPKPIFETVQRLMELDTRTAPAAESVYILSGFLRCGTCGQNMIRRSVVKKDKTYNYYYCSTYKRGEGCTSHHISEVKLMNSILAEVQYQIKLMVSADQMISAMEDPSAAQLGARGLEAQIAALEEEIERYKELKSKVYKDMTDGIVSREEFKEINARFTHKINAAKTAQEQLTVKRESNSRSWLEVVKEYQNVRQLDRRLLASLIDNIVVYDAGRLEIHFHYEDEMRAIRELGEVVV